MKFHFRASREKGLYCADLISQYVKERVDEDAPTCSLLGDHLSTYFIVRELASKYVPLNLLVFDAHHDGYKDDLCHWSHFYHLAQIPGVNIVFHGTRFEESMSAISLDRELIDAPTYISVDVDYFPNIERVGHRLDGNLDLLMKDFRVQLSALSSTKLVGFDICEWCGGSKDDFQFIEEAVLSPLLKYI